MRITAKLVVVALVLLGSAASVWAGGSIVQINRSPGMGEPGTLYDRSDWFPRVEFAPGPLPTPVEPQAAATFAKSGPISAGPIRLQSVSEGVNGGIGAGAMLAPRGSGFSTPRQQADRQIRQVIRRIG